MEVADLQARGAVLVNVRECDEWIAGHARLTVVTSPCELPEQRIERDTHEVH